MNLVKKILKNILFITPVVLLFVPNNMFFPFISGKGILFRFLVEIALCLYLIQIVKDRSLLPRKGLLLLLTSLFTLWVFIADLASPIVAKAFWSNFERMEGFVLIGHLWIYFIILSSVLRLKDDWYRFFYSVLSTAIAMSLFALLQIKGGTVINQGGVRIDSLMGNSAYFAGFCLFTFFIGLILMKEDTQKSKPIALAYFVGSLLFCSVYVLGEKKTEIGNIISSLSFLLSSGMLWLAYVLKKNQDKIFSIILFSIFLVTQVCLMFLTQTRGAALGLLGGLFVGSLFMAIFEKKGKLKIASISLVASIILIIGVFIAIKETAFVKENPVLNRFAEISWKNTSGQARQIIWPIAIEGFKERPIKGWGQEGFNYVFAKYYNPELWRHEPWFDRTHNVFLDWLVATGVIGFLLYLSLYVATIFLVIKSFFKDNKLMCAILLGLLFAYSFQNLFIFDNLGSYLLFFSLLAFVHNFSSKQAHEMVADKIKGKQSDIDPRLLISITLVISFIIFFFSVYKPYTQSRLIIKGLSPQKNISDNLTYFNKAFSLGGGGVAEAREHFMSVTNQIVQVPQLSLEVKKAFLNEMVAQAQLHKKAWSLDSKTLLSIGSGFNQNGNPDIALDLLSHVKEQSPYKQQVLLQMGISYLIKGEMVQAHSLLQETYLLSPEFPDASMLYASVLLDQSKTKEALSILEDLAGRGEMFKPYIIENLKQKGLKKELIILLNETFKKNGNPEITKILNELN